MESTKALSLLPTNVASDSILLSLSPREFDVASRDVTLFSISTVLKYLIPAHLRDNVSSSNTHTFPSVLASVGSEPGDTLLMRFPLASQLTPSGESCRQSVKRFDTRDSSVFTRSSNSSYAAFST